MTMYLKSVNITPTKYITYKFLGHPKLKLFITQGGLQSIDEAMIAGVPIIGIPIWADQWFNIEKCVQHGVGVKLELEDVEEDILMTNIKTIIGNKR